MTKESMERQNNNIPLIPDIYRDVVTNDKTLQYQLSCLLEHARVVQTWKEKLEVLFPCLTELEGHYEVDGGTRAFGGVEPFTLHEAEMQVRLKTDPNSNEYRLFWFDYSYRDYSQIGGEFGDIKKGITIREHVDPVHYMWTDTIKKDKWLNPLEVSNPIFEQVVAMSLSGSIGSLTPHNHIETLVNSYALQKGIVL